MNKSIKGVLKYIVFIAIAVGLLWLAIPLPEAVDGVPFEGSALEGKKIKIAEIWENVKTATPFWVILSVIMGYLAIMSRGIRWQYLIEPMGYKVNTWNSIHSVAFSYLSNMGVPRSGELARCAALNQTDDVPVGKLFGTVIAERLVDFMMLLLFATVGFLANVDTFYRFLEKYNEQGISKEEATGLAWWQWAAIIGAILFVVVLIVFRKKLPLIKEKILAFLLQLKEGLLSVKTMKNRGKFIFHTLYIWASYFFMSYICFFSLAETSDTGPAAAMFVMVAGGVGMVLPAPGGIGSYHFFVALSMVAIGFTQDVGLTLAWIIWTGQSIMVIVGGLIGVLALALTRRRQEKRIAKNV